MSPLHLLRALDTAIMPVRCVFCGTRARDDEGFICIGCQADLPWNDTSLISSGPVFERVIAPLEYAFPIDAAIKAFKFRRKLFYGPAFAQLLCSNSHDLPDDIDALLPVPLHWRRKWWRGFNQALEIARPLAKHLGLPVIDIARRHRATPPQSGLSAKQRAANLRGAFRVKSAQTYGHVLVIDDVITTGTTISQLGHALRRGGIARVSAFALARSGER
jgi:ComF family protein